MSKAPQVLLWSAAAGPAAATAALCVQRMVQPGRPLAPHVTRALDLARLQFDTLVVGEDTSDHVNDMMWSYNLNTGDDGMMRAGGSVGACWSGACGGGAVASGQRKQPSRCAPARCRRHPGPHHDHPVRQRGHLRLLVQQHRWLVLPHGGGAAPL